MKLVLAIALFLICVALFLIAAGACLAQLSLPNITDTQFDRTDGSVNDRPLLLQPFAGGLTRPGVSIQGSDEQTIRETQPGRGVLEDLHANSQSANALIANPSRPNGLRAFLHASRLSDSGTLDQGATEIGLSGNLNEADAGIVWPVGRLTMRFAYEHARYSAGGQSNLYAGLFQIFPPEPPFSLDKREDIGTLSVAYRIAPAWSAEIDASEEGSPGTFALTDPSAPTRLAVPIGDHGSSQTYALSYAISHASRVYAFTGSESFEGSGAIEREGGLGVGQSAVSRFSRQTGAAWERRFGGSRTLRVYGEEDELRWSIEGSVPRPAEIGITTPLAHDLGFSAGYDVHSDIVGLSWEQAWGASHALYAGYRYGQLRAHVNASEGMIILLFPVGQSTNQDIDNLNGHILQLRYRFPIWKLSAELGALQVIPATSGATVSGTSSGGGGTGGVKPLGPPHTYGGWALTWGLAYEF